MVLADVVAVLVTTNPPEVVIIEPAPLASRPSVSTPLTVTLPPEMTTPAGRSQHALTL